MAINARTIFVVDALGALLSVLLLGLVLPALEPWLGMPRSTLSALTLWAGGCLGYDLLCYGFADLRRPRWLRGIMAANLTYCGVTASLIVIHLDGLTPWGIAYFVAEIPVIVALVIYEYRIHQRTFAPPDPRGGLPPSSGASFDADR